jgi:hypothetical protein
MTEACEKRDPVELMLRCVRRRALQRALCIAGPAGALACNPAAVTPAAMPSTPIMSVPIPPPPSAAPPELVVPERIHCEEGASFPVSAWNLTPILPVDYLAIRTSRVMPDENATPTWTKTPFETLSQRGTPCESAPPGSECKSMIELHPNVPANAHCIQMCTETSVVTTRGGDVKRWATPQELGQLLAPIDTVDEALLLVNAAHYAVSCQSETTRVRRVQNGYEVYATRMTAMCAPIITTGYWLRVADTGEIEELSSEEVSRSEQACVGRRPEGLCEVSWRSSQPQREQAEFLARSAHLEDASVLAFERLARELRELGAPYELVRDAERARADEIRHARVMTAMARARGAQVPAAKVLEAGPRTLESMALENAVEGCVFETFGAVLGAWQAMAATDDELRAEMGPIAEDELRHASLSHRIHAWAMAELDAAARDRVKRSISKPVDELTARTPGYATEARLALGLPSREQRAALLRELSSNVWTPMLS